MNRRHATVYVQLNIQPSARSCEDLNSLFGANGSCTRHGCEARIACGGVRIRARFEQQRDAVRILSNCDSIVKRCDAAHEVKGAELLARVALCARVCVCIN
eukprot:6178325-Pleurochrysis_carterae.AAC.7